MCNSKQLINCLNCVVEIYFKFMICGDCNFPRTNWSVTFDPQSLPVQEVMFASFVVDNGLLQLVKEPTRASNALEPAICERCTVCA